MGGGGGSSSELILGVGLPYAIDLPSLKHVCSCVGRDPSENPIMVQASLSLGKQMKRHLLT